VSGVVLSILAGAGNESPPSQVKALLDAASGSRPEAFGVVAIHTGLRRSELLGLRSASADLGAGTWTVRVSLDVNGTFKAPKDRAAKRPSSSPFEP
jgi:integrase